jgi:hypothetical protein
MRKLSHFLILIAAWTLTGVQSAWLSSSKREKKKEIDKEDEDAYEMSNVTTGKHRRFRAFTSQELPASTLQDTDGPVAVMEAPIQHGIDREPHASSDFESSEDIPAIDHPTSSASIHTWSCKSLFAALDQRFHYFLHIDIFMAHLNQDFEASLRQRMAKANAWEILDVEIMLKLLFGNAHYEKYLKAKAKYYLKQKLRQIFMDPLEILSFLETSPPGKSSTKKLSETPILPLDLIPEFFALFSDIFHAWYDKLLFLYLQTIYNSCITQDSCESDGMNHAFLKVPQRNREDGIAAEPDCILNESILTLAEEKLLELEGHHTAIPLKIPDQVKASSYDALDSVPHQPSNLYSIDNPSKLDALAIYLRQPDFGALLFKRLVRRLRHFYSTYKDFCHDFTCAWIKKDLLSKKVSNQMLLLLLDFSIATGFDTWHSYAKVIQHINSSEHLKVLFVSASSFSEAHYSMKEIPMVLGTAQYNYFCAESADILKKMAARYIKQQLENPSLFIKNHVMEKEKQEEFYFVHKIWLDALKRVLKESQSTSLLLSPQKLFSIKLACEDEFKKELREHVLPPIEISEKYKSALDEAYGVFFRVQYAHRPTIDELSCHILPLISSKQKCAKHRVKFGNENRSLLEQQPPHRQLRRRQRQQEVPPAYQMQPPGMSFASAFSYLLDRFASYWD